MKNLKQQLVRVLLGVPITILTLGIVGAIHQAGYFPEDTVTGMIMGAPTFFATEVVRWALAFLLALVVWGIADFFVYRRRFPKLPSMRMVLWIGLITGVALVVVCAAALYFRQTPTKTTAKSLDPITWEGDYLLRAATTDWGVEFYGFQWTARNNTDRFIKNLGGFVRSEKNGKTFPILLHQDNKLVPPEGYGLPARHQFHLGVEFMPRGNGLPGAKFLAEYGVITFVFRYEEQEFTRLYSFEEISAEVERTERDLKPKAIKSEAGFKKVSNDEQLSSSDARHRLAALRSEGVAIRNAGMTILDSSAWPSDTLGWMNRVINTIELIDKADAEWFKTLDTVPQPRVNHHPNASPRLAKAFREHDYRLKRLDDLLRGYSERRT